MACNKVTTQLYSVSHSELVLDTGHEGGREQETRLFTNCWGGNFTIMKGSKALIATEDQQLDLNKEKKTVGGTQNDSDGNWN